jgi:hypothetical protein
MSITVLGRSLRLPVLLVTAPVLLIYAIFKAPAWVHDFHLSQLEDRVVQYPLPPGGSAPSFYGPQSKVSGDSGDCTFHVRFDVVTDRPVEEVLKHYETAAIAKADEVDANFSIDAWVQQGYTQPTRREAGYEYQTVIVNLDAQYLGSSLWDPRCW